jgi:hypothetical protein
MKASAALVSIALTLGAAVLVSGRAAQAEPIAINTCQHITKPGSYVLARNLSSTGNCLVIAASSVTIDLAGFSIVGPGVGPTGILANPGVEFTAVRNGSISNFTTCVQLENDGSAVVEHLRVSGCVNGIQASGIVNSNIVEGYDSGLAIQSTGLISGNRVFNSHSGIDVGTGSTVIGNTITRGGGASNFGIQVSCPSNVIDNTVTDYLMNLALIGTGCNTANNVAPPIP